VDFRLYASSTTTTRPNKPVRRLRKWDNCNSVSSTSSLLSAIPPPFASCALSTYVVVIGVIGRTLYRSSLRNLVISLGHVDRFGIGGRGKGVRRLSVCSEGRTTILAVAGSSGWPAIQAKSLPGWGANVRSRSI